MVSKILIATDGSKYSETAADYGLGLAKKMESDVVALYVISTKNLEMFALGHHDDIGGYERANDQLKAEGGRALDYVASRGVARGVTVTKILSRGHPAEEIVKAARDKGVVLIVTGSLGKTGLEHLLLGSVSEAVVRTATCPVLVVRQ
jgi:nucleotide-binding universal stress UspA family protein